MRRREQDSEEYIIALLILTLLYRNIALRDAHRDAIDGRRRSPKLPGLLDKSIKGRIALPVMVDVGEL